MPIASYILFGIAVCVFAYGVLLLLGALGWLNMPLWYPGRARDRAKLERWRAELSEIEGRLRELGNMHGTVAVLQEYERLMVLHEKTIVDFDRAAHRVGLPKYKSFKEVE